MIFIIILFLEKSSSTPLPTVVEVLVRWGVGMSKPSWLISFKTKDTASHISKLLKALSGSAVSLFFYLILFIVVCCDCFIIAR